MAVATGADFADHGISYHVSPLTASQLYEAFEPRLNGGELELLDVPKMQEQFLTLITRGGKIDHAAGEHDDWSNACAGAIWVAGGQRMADWEPGTAAVLGKPLETIGAGTPWGEQARIFDRGPEGMMSWDRGGGSPWN